MPLVSWLLAGRGGKGSAALTLICLPGKGTAVVYTVPIGTFVKTIDGVVKTRRAYSREDVVRLKFAGWREKRTGEKPAETKAKSVTKPQTT